MLIFVILQCLGNNDKKNIWVCSGQMQYVLDMELIDMETTLMKGQLQLIKYT